MSTDTLDSHWNQPVTSLLGEGYLDYMDLGENDVGPFADFGDPGDEREGLEFGYAEGLDFAFDHDHIPSELILTWGDDLETSTLDDVRVLRLIKQALIAIAKECDPQYPSLSSQIDSLSLDADFQGDSNHVEVTIYVPADAAMTVRKMMDTIVNPFFGLMINSTDPGTFFHPYLWSKIEELIKEESK